MYFALSFPLLLMRWPKYHLSLLSSGQRGLVQAFHDLTSSLRSSSMIPYLIIHQRSLYNHPACLLPRARILVSQEGDYKMNILLETIEKGTVYSECVLYKVVL